MREYIRLGIIVSPIITIVIISILGALFGALYECLDKKMNYPARVIPIAITGLLLSILLVLPNMVIGSIGKAHTNSITCLVYTLTLLLLVYKKNPRVTVKNEQ